MNRKKILAIVIAMVMAVTAMPLPLFALEQQVDIRTLPTAATEAAQEREETDEATDEEQEEETDETQEADEAEETEQETQGTDAADETQETDQGSQDTQATEEAQESEEEAPDYTFSVEYYDNTLQWESVEDSDYYIVWINADPIYQTTTPELDLYELHFEEGFFIVQVEARTEEDDAVLSQPLVLESSGDDEGLSVVTEEEIVEIIEIITEEPQQEPQAEPETQPEQGQEPEQDQQLQPPVLPLQPEQDPQPEPEPQPAPTPEPQPEQPQEPEQQEPQEQEPQPPVHPVPPIAVIPFPPVVLPDEWEPPQVEEDDVPDLVTPWDLIPSPGAGFGPTPEWQEPGFGPIVIPPTGPGYMGIMTLPQLLTPEDLAAMAPADDEPEGYEEENEENDPLAPIYIPPTGPGYMGIMTLPQVLTPEDLETMADPDDYPLGPIVIPPTGPGYMGVMTLPEILPPGLLPPLGTPIPPIHVLPVPVLPPLLELVNYTMQVTGPGTVQQHGAYSITAHVFDYYGYPVSEPISFSLMGAAYAAIDSNGTLTVGYEPAGVLYVHVYLSQHPHVNGSLAVTVIAPQVSEPHTVSLIAPEAVLPHGEYAITAHVFDYYGDIMHEPVTFSLVGAGYATIGSNGLLTVGDEPAGVLRVYAALVDYPHVVGYVDVEVLAVEVVGYYTISLIAPEIMLQHGEYAITAQVFDYYGYPVDEAVVFSLVGAEYAVIDSDGLLSVGEEPAGFLRVYAALVDYPHVVGYVDLEVMGILRAMGVMPTAFDFGNVTQSGNFPSFPFRRYDFPAFVVGAGVHELDGLLPFGLGYTLLFEGPFSITHNLEFFFGTLANRSLVAIYNIHYLDTSNVTNMSSAFQGASQLTNSDLAGISQWNVSNVTNFVSMFGSASGLTDLDLTGWTINGSQSVSMASMFGATGLVTLHSIANWDVSNVTSMMGMFVNATALTSIDLSGWDTRHNPFMDNMFSGASAINTLILGSNFQFNNFNLGGTQLPNNVGLRSGYWTSGTRTYNTVQFTALTAPNLAGTWTFSETPPPPLTLAVYPSTINVPLGFRGYLQLQGFNSGGVQDWIYNSITLLEERERIGVFPLSVDGGFRVTVPFTASLGTHQVYITTIFGDTLYFTVNVVPNPRTLVFGPQSPYPVSANGVALFVFSFQPFPNAPNWPNYVFPHITDLPLLINEPDGIANAGASAPTGNIGSGFFSVTRDRFQDFDTPGWPIVYVPMPLGRTTLQVAYADGTRTTTVELYVTEQGAGSGPGFNIENYVRPADLVAIRNMVTNNSLPQRYYDPNNWWDIVSWYAYAHDPGFMTVGQLHLNPPGLTGVLDLRDLVSLHSVNVAGNYLTGMNVTGIVGPFGLRTIIANGNNMTSQADIIGLSNPLPHGFYLRFYPQRGQTEPENGYQPPINGYEPTDPTEPTEEYTTETPPEEQQEEEQDPTDPEQPDPPRDLYDILNQDTLDTITDPYSAAQAVEDAILYLLANNLLTEEGLARLALFAELAISQAAALHLFGADIHLGIIVNQPNLTHLQQIALQTLQLIENVLTTHGVELARDISPNVAFIVTEAYELDITVEPSAMLVDVERVRIRTPHYEVSFAYSFLEAHAYEPLFITIYEQTNSPRSYTVNFSRPVEESVRLSVTPPPVPVDMAAYLTLMNGEGDIATTRLNPVTDRLEAQVMHSGTYTVVNNRMDFADIQNLSAEMQRAIRTLTSQGVINGLTPQEFGPSDNLSRAQVAALFTNTLGINDPRADGNFTDVTQSDWFFGAVGSAARHDIMHGTGGGMFSPQLSIPRDQLVATTSRVLQQRMGYRTPANPNAYLNTFNDRANLADWSVPELALAARENLVVRRADGNFMPNQSITRGEAALIIYRLHMRIW